jgi:hypothetical protein
MRMRLRSGRSSILAFALFTPVFACSDFDSGNTEPPSGAVASPEPDSGALPHEPPIQTAALWGEAVNNPARPMVAGTLTVTPGGEFALASDSERDLIYVVELASRKTRRLTLEANDEPGRIVSGRVDGASRHVYVVLRRGDALADVDLGSGEVARVPTCKAPRGIAYDDDREIAHVACANGELVTYAVNGWSEARRVFVAPDLRDVEIVDDTLVLSRYTSSEVLLLDEDGVLVSRSIPAALPACADASVAHRLAVSGGQVYLAHQLSRTAAPEASSCSVPMVASLLTREPLERFANAANSTWQTMSTIAPTDGAKLELKDEDSPFAAHVSVSSGPLDFAIGARGRAVISLAGNHWVDTLPTIITLEPETSDGSGWTRIVRQFRPAGMVTSVALDDDDEWLAFSREPAAIYFEDESPIFVGGASVNNSGFSLLHMNAGTGISCVSCHPEGGQDDHVWHRLGGSRLTLPLRGARAPFNWNHSAADMSFLLMDVLYGQMGYPLNVTTDQANVLQLWLSGLPVVHSPFVDGSQVERGATLFAASEVGCATCHAGSAYTDYRVHDVDTGGVLATPSLLGLASRSNYLHDGCAATLEDVFGLCGGSHRSVQNLKREEVADLLAFLASL